MLPFHGECTKTDSMMRKWVPDTLSKNDSVGQQGIIDSRHKTQRLRKPQAERQTPADVSKSEGAGTANVQDKHQPVTLDAFRLYLDEIKRYPPLSREDEMDLAIRYREKGI